VDVSALQVQRLVLQARLEELVDRFAAGQITGQQLERGSATLRAQLADFDQQLADAAGTSALDGVVGPAAAEVWATLDLSRPRAILDILVTVTVHRTRRGRPPGWQSGQSYFDPRGIEIGWRA